ncbi:MAG: hypothetical protein JRG87_15000 [Deltaproteobacteria bacterium]|nr:hypothetical protein [Deltaproteobacteria bacterium]
MHRMKAFLIILAIIVMVVTCFSSIALGARAYKMDKWKGHVFIDGGENEDPKKEREQTNNKDWFQ